MTCPFICDRMMKVRPGHGMEDCGVSLAFFVVFSEVADGVQISHVSDPTIDGAVDCSCAILNLSRRDNSGCLQRAGYGDEGLQDEDLGKMLLNECQQSLHRRTPQKRSVQLAQFGYNHFSANYLNKSRVKKCNRLEPLSLLILINNLSYFFPSLIID